MNYKRYAKVILGIALLHAPIAHGAARGDIGRAKIALQRQLANPLSGNNLAQARRNIDLISRENAAQAQQYTKDLNTKLQQVSAPLLRAPLTNPAAVEQNIAALTASPSPADKALAAQLKKSLDDARTVRTAAEDKKSADAAAPKRAAEDKKAADELATKKIEEQKKEAARLARERAAQEEEEKNLARALRESEQEARDRERAQLERERLLKQEETRRKAEQQEQDNVDRALRISAEEEKARIAKQGKEADDEAQRVEARREEEEKKAAELARKPKLDPRTKDIWTKFLMGDDVKKNVQNNEDYAARIRASLPTYPESARPALEAALTAFESALKTYKAKNQGILTAIDSYADDSAIRTVHDKFMADVNRGVSELREAVSVADKAKEAAAKADKKEGDDTAKLAEAKRREEEAQKEKTVLLKTIEAKITEAKALRIQIKQSKLDPKVYKPRSESTTLLIADLQKLVDGKLDNITIEKAQEELTRVNSELQKIRTTLEVLISAKPNKELNDKKETLKKLTTETIKELEDANKTAGKNIRQALQELMTTGTPQQELKDFFSPREEEINKAAVIYTDSIQREMNTIDSKTTLESLSVVEKSIEKIKVEGLAQIKSSYEKFVAALEQFKAKKQTESRGRKAELREKYISLIDDRIKTVDEFEQMINKRLGGLAGITEPEYVKTWKNYLTQTKAVIDTFKKNLAALRIKIKGTSAETFDNAAIKKELDAISVPYNESYEQFGDNYTQFNLAKTQAAQDSKRSDESKIVKEKVAAAKDAEAKDKATKPKITTAEELFAFINDEDADGTAMSQAIKQAVLDGISVNAQDEDDFTLLMRATLLPDIDLVKFLLARGADIRIKNNENQDALQVAKQIAQEERDSEDKDTYDAIVTLLDDTLKKALSSSTSAGTGARSVVE